MHFPYIVVLVEDSHGVDLPRSSYNPNPSSAPYQYSTKGKENILLKLFGSDTRCPQVPGHPAAEYVFPAQSPQSVVLITIFCSLKNWLVGHWDEDHKALGDPHVDGRGLSDLRSSGIESRGKNPTIQSINTMGQKDRGRGLTDSHTMIIQKSSKDSTSRTIQRRSIAPLIGVLNSTSKIAINGSIAIGPQYTSRKRDETAC